LEARQVHDICPKIFFPIFGGMPPHPTPMGSQEQTYADFYTRQVVQF